MQDERCTRTARLGAGLATLALAFLASAGPAAPIATAAEPGRVEWRVTLEPADVAPGGKGTLVVRAELGALHLYATDSSALTWRSLPAAGVTYGIPDKPGTWETRPTALQVTTPHEFKEEGLEPYLVWEDKPEPLVLKVAVEIGKDVKPGTEIGLVFDYSGCDKGRCYRRQKDHAATIRVGKSPEAATDAAPPSNGEGPGAVPVPGASPSPDATAGNGGPRKGPKVGEPCSNAAATVSVDVHEDPKDPYLAVVFAPKEGYHLYFPGASTGDPITVEPIAAEGVTWGAVSIPATGEEIHERTEVKVPYTRANATRLQVRVGWQGCDASACIRPESCTLAVDFAGSALIDAVPTPKPPDVKPPNAKPPEPPVVAPKAAQEPAPEPPAGEEKVTPAHGKVLVDVVEGTPTEAKAESDAERMWREKGILYLAILFLIGVGLAFTPCVLPLIPITVTVIAGGRADIPKRRLTMLLLAYVFAMSATFGTIGLLASLAGKGMSGAFQSPTAIWILGGLFAALAFGMLGIYELQPPAWLLNMQGGAQKRAGSLLGALLMGALGAVIASPCTGPVVAGILLFTAKEGNAPLGFLMFFVLGLGTGSVLFAAGALNFLSKPGPWMVWVRYVFGVILVGCALYYVAHNGLLYPPMLFVVGFALAALAFAGIVWHLTKKEGAPAAEAQVRGAKVAVLMVLATAAVAFLTKAPPSNLKWTTLKDVAHLKQELDAAKASGTPVLVDVTAKWCANCHKYERLMDEKELRVRFEKMALLRIDVTDDDRGDLREALGIPGGSQPFMVFVDRKGRRLRAADVDEWYGDEARGALEKRLGYVVPKDAVAAN